MDAQDPTEGVVYTETIIHSAPERFVADVPYQVAIVEFESGRRLTVRILGKDLEDQARIGDRVVFVENRQGTLYFRKAHNGNK